MAGTMVAGLSMKQEDEGNAVASDNSQVFRKFVMEHLKSFLRPVAEHVEELKNELADVRSSLKSLQVNLQDRVISSEAKLALLASQLSTFAAVQDKENVIRAHEMATVGRRLQHAEKACQDATAATQRITVRLDTHSNGIEDLKQALDNTNSNVNRLQLKHWQTQGLAQQVESKLSELKDEHLALCERHASQSRGLAQTNLSSEQQRIALGALDSKLDGVEKKVGGMVDSLANKVLLAERCLGKVKEVQMEQAKEVVPMALEVRRLSQAMSRLEDEVEHGMQAGDDFEGRQEHTPHHPRAVGDIDSAIQEIRQIASNGGDKKYQEMVLACVQRVKKISDEMTEICPLVRISDSTTKSHQEHLNELDLRMRDHENWHNISHDRVNTAEVNITNLAAGAHDVLSKMQSISSDMATTQTSQTRLLKEFGETQATVRTVVSDVKTQEAGFQQLLTRVEVAYEYLHGLGRGLQDTHRSIVQGSDGLLAPRPASANKHNVALPTLTVPTPRPVTRLTEFARPGTSPPQFGRTATPPGQ